VRMTWTMLVGCGWPGQSAFLFLRHMFPRERRNKEAVRKANILRCTQAIFWYNKGNTVNEKVNIWGAQTALSTIARCISTHYTLYSYPFNKNVSLQHNSRPNSQPRAFQ
jgi:hypothetical protein